MSVFSSNEERTLERKVESCVIEPTPRDKLKTVYQIEKCEQWIRDNNFAKVCLQFPDHILCDSPDIVLVLQESTACQCFILGDTSYGSCCVDEVSAEHVDAGGIIHFGHACLSPTRRLPVLYIFQEKPLSTKNLLTTFSDFYTDCESKVLLIYDVAYCHAIDDIRRALSHKYKNIVQAYPGLGIADKGSTTCLSCRYSLPEGAALGEYSVLFIGNDGRTLSNYILELAECTINCYNPAEPQQGIKKMSGGCSKFLMQRMHLVERVKDAGTLGILIGTLGVAGYLDAIKHIKMLAKQCGKKTYIVAVGRPNVPKLANFPEIDVFVLVACPENTLLDWREFYKPVVSLYEVELACNPNCKWSARYMTSFQDILTESRKHIYPSNTDNESGGAVDVSLVTGKMRSLKPVQGENTQSGDGTMCERSSMTVMSTGGQFLLNRSWQGLEQKMGQSEVKLAEKGRSGIAAAYSCEGENSKK